MSILMICTTQSSGIVTESTFKSILLQIFSIFDAHLDRKKPPTPGDFSIYYVPQSRTRRKRTPLEEFVPPSKHQVLRGGSSSSGFLIREHGT